MLARSALNRRILAVLFLGCAAHLGAQQESAVSPAQPIGNAASVPPPMNMGLVAPLVIESGDWTSLLTMVNESKNQVHAQLAVRTAYGELVAATTVTLPGHSSRRVPVGVLLGSAADLIGFLTVNIQEPDAAQNMAVAAQLTLLGRGTLIGTSIDQELEMPMMGSNFKSVVDGPSALLAIQNQGMETASATATCLQQGVAAQTQIQIPPNGLRFLHNCQVIEGDLTSASHVLPDLSFNSQAGGNSGSANRPAAFQIDGGSAELTVFGLSAPDRRGDRIGAAMFVNQSDFTSSTTVFAGIPIGAYSALPGAAFASTLSMANLTAKTRTVKVRGAFDDSLNPPKVLSTITLQPFETRQFDLSAETAIGSAMESILADQDGPPGDVVFALTDRDSVTQAVLQPLPKFLHHANNGGAHPWTLRNQASSTLVVFNAGAKAQILNLNLGADGIVWSKTLTIQPNQTLILPIKEIIESANADLTSGKPKITALQGEISWFTPDQADVFGRILVAREGNGGSVIESYSCGSNIVLCGMSLYNSFATIDYGANGFLGPLSPQFCASYSPTICSGTQYGAGGASGYNWNSTNVGVTPISGSSTQSNVSLHGQALGAGGGVGSGYTGSCQASAGGTAQVNPIITWNGNDITNQTAQAIIGQQIVLDVVPAGTQQTWSMSYGTAYGGWTAGTSSAQYSPIILNQPTMTFYELTPVSNQGVAVTVTVGGQQYHASTMFSVVAPTASITATTGSDQVNTSYLYGSGWWVYFGGLDSNHYGITFQPNLAVASGFQSGGNVEFVQIQNLFHEERQDVTGSYDHRQFDNMTCLDTTYPYDGPWTVGSLGALAVDAPGSALGQVAEVFHYRFDQFTMYLLWQPNYPNSIYVPVAQVQWFWAGGVQLSGSTWYLPSTSFGYAWYDWSANPASSQSNGPLTWSCNNTTWKSSPWQAGQLQ